MMNTYNLIAPVAILFLLYFIEKSLYYKRRFNKWKITALQMQEDANEMARQSGLGNIFQNSEAWIEIEALRRISYKHEG